MGKKKRKEYQKPPPSGKRKHGLYNQGATCYLNSVLQVLFMTPEFRKALQSSSGPEPMDQHLLKLFKSLEKETTSTSNITRTLEIKVNQQSDAAEYFEHILMRTSAKFSKVFKGELTVKCKCLTCENESRTNQPFWSLPLPLVESDNDCKVVDGIKEYFKESRITGENQLHCHNCNNKTESTVKLDMNQHPEVLTLLLKRFDFDYNKRMFIKNHQSVEVPFRLTVENRKYELYAFVDHCGSLKGGHYTVTIKTQDDEKWHHFDDTAVTLLNYQPFQVDCSERSESAYLLFYKAYENDDNSTQNVEGSPAGESRKTSLNALEKDKDSENGHESDDNESNKKKRHCSSQLDNDKQSITSVNDGDIVENLGKLRDDGTCVTNVEIENINQKTVDDRKEAGKNQKPSDGNNGAKITQTLSKGSHKRRQGNKKAQGNQQQQTNEEPGPYVVDNSLKVQTAEELQCLNHDDQENTDYQKNREEKNLSKANKTEFFSEGRDLSKSPPEEKKNSFREEKDEDPVLTKTKPEGLLNEKVEDQCKIQGELQDDPKGEVKETVEVKRIKVDENMRGNGEKSILKQVLARSNAVGTKKDKPAQVFPKPKAASMDQTDLDTPFDNKKVNRTQQESLREEIHLPAVATQLIQMKGRAETKERNTVMEALLRSKLKDAKRTETKEQIKLSETDETDLSISSKTGSVPFRKAESQEIPDPEDTRPQNSSKVLSKSDHHDFSPQKSSTQSMNPSTTETQPFGDSGSSEVECVVGKRQDREDRKAGENGQPLLVQQLYESEGLPGKQIEPAEEGKAQLEIQPQVGFTNDGQRLMEIQSNSENLKDLPSTAPPEQTIGNQPEEKSSAEADIQTDPGSQVQKQTASEKPKKGKTKFKKLFSMGVTSPRR